MILARERRTTSGNRYYELTESQSRTKKSWTPPRNLSPAQIEDALFAAGALFESEINISSQFSPLVVPAQNEKDMTLEEYVQTVFIPRKAVRVAERTKDSWNSYLRLRIIPRLGHIKIRDITPSDLMDFDLGLQAEGLSISSVRKYHSLLKCIFKMAYTTEIIDRNPMDRVERPSPREDEESYKKTPAYTAEEIAYIEACMQKEPLQWQVYLGMLIGSGMRNG